jgi:hypothetical protein
MNRLLAAILFVLPVCFAAQVSVGSVKGDPTASRPK